MVSKVKQVVGYGILNFILFTIVSLIFSVKGHPEWHSLLTVFAIMIIAAALIYRKHPMAIYLMALAMLFVGITIVTALVQLVIGKIALHGVMLGIGWVIVLLNLIAFGLWIKAAVQYRRGAGIYFRK
ncbi:hypothetical protein [Periweissella ghanensis]|uniref:Uncharacterized protein n=1 Tax=Periweissella ghanensis TaxID=467997 RepID=A0ABN8BPG2_9LACO|nr:hypothetical protein [Periweissella ghanensis]MCM0600706.1 hypothetical protein [Periweissella ghanensis]CAH0418521.1 hypothetical protein WGH24286_00939 [Periweissella ghanensis]